MSRWDEYDRMLERFEQGRMAIAENNARDAIAPNDDVIENWNEKTKEVLSLINNGVVKTDEWSVNKANWVEFKTGSFRGRSLNVSYVISEKRVTNYLSNHGITITNSEISALMDDLDGLNAEKSKIFLKNYILKNKTSSRVKHRSVTPSPPSHTNNSRFDSQSRPLPCKKPSLLSKIINFIFGI